MTHLCGFESPALIGKENSRHMYNHVVHRNTTVEIAEITYMPQQRNFKIQLQQSRLRPLVVLYCTLISTVVYRAILIPP